MSGVIYVVVMKSALVYRKYLNIAGRKLKKLECELDGLRECIKKYFGKNEDSSKTKIV